MGGRFSRCTSCCLAVPKEEKRKTKRSRINHLHTVMESFEYPVDRFSACTNHVDMFRFIPEG